jgi:hypothetical protein
MTEQMVCSDLIIAEFEELLWKVGWVPPRYLVKPQGESWGVVEEPPPERRELRAFPHQQKDHLPRARCAREGDGTHPLGPLSLVPAHDEGQADNKLGELGSARRLASSRCDFVSSLLHWIQAVRPRHPTNTRRALAKFLICDLELVTTPVGSRYFAAP